MPQPLARQITQTRHQIAGFCNRAYVRQADQDAGEGSRESGGRMPVLTIARRSLVRLHRSSLHAYASAAQPAFSGMNERSRASSDAGPSQGRRNVLRPLPCQHCRRGLLLQSSNDSVTFAGWHRAGAGSLIQCLPSIRIGRRPRGPESLWPRHLRPTSMKARSPRAQPRKFYSFLRQDLSATRLRAPRLSRFVLVVAHRDRHRSVAGTTADA